MGTPPAKAGTAPARRGRDVRFFTLFLVLALFPAGGCAVPKTACIDNTLAAVRSLHDARYRFGAPWRTEAQADGNMRSEWLLDVEYEQPGHYETEISPWVRHDSDGYRVETEREVYKRPRKVSKFCRLAIISDREGRVLSAEYEGGDCCDLVIRPAAVADSVR